MHRLKQLILIVCIDDPSIYVLMGNLRAAIQNWHKSRFWAAQMQQRGIKKIPGVSWIELNGIIHTFKVADKVHPQQVFLNYNFLQSHKF